MKNKWCLMKITDMDCFITKFKNSIKYRMYFLNNFQPAISKLNNNGKIGKKMYF